MRRTAPETFTAKMDADTWLAMQRAAIENGSWRGRDDRTTVGEFADEWVKALQVRDRTRYHYQVNLDKWIKPAFGTTPMSAVTPAMVRKWVGGFPVDTPAARANAYRVLSQVFRAAVEDGIVSESPVKVKGAGQYTRKREGHALQAPRSTHFRSRSLRAAGSRSCSAHSVRSGPVRCWGFGGGMSILRRTL